MIRDYDIGAFGPGKIWDGPIDSAFVSRVRSLSIRELSLRALGGRRLDSLAPLRELPDLLGLHLIPGRRLDDADWSVLHDFQQLRYFANSHDLVSGSLDLRRLGDIHWASLPWWRALRGYDTSTLRGLALRSWHHTQSAILPPDLVFLELVQADLPDLAAIAHLGNLRSLRLLRSRKMVSLKGVERLASLEELELEGLPLLEDLGQLAACKKLAKLRIQDCPKVVSLEGTDVPSLQALWLMGSTVLKGSDLAWLDHHRSLRHAIIGHDPHYRCDFARLANLEHDDPITFLPAYHHRVPAVHSCEWMSGVPSAVVRQHLYPDWFRRAHPELCI